MYKAFFLNFNVEDYLDKMFNFIDYTYVGKNYYIFIIKNY